MKPTRFFFAFSLFILLSVAASRTIFAQTLPAKVRGYLNENYSGWKPYAGDPICNSRAVVSGNFNGDGKTDYAVMFKKGQSGFVIAFVSQNTNYDAEVLERGSADDLNGTFLSVGRKGTKYSKTQRLKYDAPEGGGCEASSYFWIYNNGSFQQVFTSD